MPNRLADGLLLEVEHSQCGVPHLRDGFDAVEVVAVLDRVVGQTSKLGQGVAEMKAVGVDETSVT